MLVFQQNIIFLANNAEIQIRICVCVVGTKPLMC